MTLYAAYGSNLDPEQMLERAPASPAHGTGWLIGWRLTFGGEDIGGNLRGRKAEHPPGLLAGKLGVGPAAGDHTNDERLAGPGRPDQRLDPGTGGEHAAHGGGLVDAGTHEAVTRGGFGAELTAVIQHGAFDWLDAPI